MREPTAGPVPGFAERERMWRELSVAREPELPALAAYADALRAVYTNGGVRCGSFRVAPHPVLEWYATRGQWHESGFFGRFFGVGPARELAPEAPRELNFYARDVFEQTSAFQLGGLLAGMLFDGGAYARHAPGAVDAKRLGDEAAAEIVRERWGEVLVYTSGVAWSGFFRDVAWDRTLVVLAEEEGARTVHVLLATDTD